MAQPPPASSTRAVAALALLALAAGCQRDAPGVVTLSVFAAASLREAFSGLAASFERARPGTHVALQLGGSQQLRVQIEHGAACDLFASADEAQMAPLVGAGLVEPPTVFAHNELVVVVPRDGAGELTRFWDLPRAGRIALGAPEAPIGRYADRALERAAAVAGAAFREGVLARVVSRELDTRQTLAKAVLGEVDAAIVYRSDAQAAGDKVRVVPLPPEVAVTAAYLVAVLRRTTPAVQPLARAFAAALLSEQGRGALAGAGFRP